MLASAKEHIICDIDGTIADLTHRLHYIKPEPGGKKDWRSFHANVIHDTPYRDVLEIMFALQTLNDTFHSKRKVWLVSGRMEYTRKDTEEWLDEYLWPWFDIAGLFMRPTDDYRDDAEIKEEILDTVLIPAGVTPETTLAVLDDRDRVVAMWRRRGFRVLQVAHGDF